MSERIEYLARVAETLNTRGFKHLAEDVPQAGVVFNENCEYLTIGDELCGYDSENDHRHDFETCRRRLMAQAMALAIVCAKDDEQAQDFLRIRTEALSRVDIECEMCGGEGRIVNAGPEPSDEDCPRCGGECYLHPDKYP